MWQLARSSGSSKRLQMSCRISAGSANTDVLLPASSCLAAGGILAPLFQVQVIMSDGQGQDAAGKLDTPAMAGAARRVVKTCTHALIHGIDTFILSAVHSSGTMANRSWHYCMYIICDKIVILTSIAQT
jgi:hypothetical protein